ncbi:hypothetical protein CDAR_504481, partial [Caerostris darwini]
MPPQASGDGNEVDMTEYPPLSSEDILSQKANGNDNPK